MKLPEAGAALVSRVGVGFEDRLRFRGLKGRGTVAASEAGGGVVEVLSASAIDEDGAGTEVTSAI